MLRTVFPPRFQLVPPTPPSPTPLGRMPLPPRIRHGPQGHALRPHTPGFRRGEPWGALPRPWVRLGGWGGWWGMRCGGASLFGHPPTTVHTPHQPCPFLGAWARLGRANAWGTRSGVEITSAHRVWGPPPQGGGPQRLSKRGRGVGGPMGLGSVWGCPTDGLQQPCTLGGRGKHGHGGQNGKGWGELPMCGIAQGARGGPPHTPHTPTTVQTDAQHVGACPQTRRRVVQP